VLFKRKLEKVPEADEKRRKFAAVMLRRPTRTPAPVAVRAIEEPVNKVESSD
jgi:hypothetical protein